MKQCAVKVLLVLLFCGGLAQAGETALEWSQLSAQQQTVLKPFEQQWQQFPPERRSRLLKGVERWQDMNPEQRVIMSKRFAHWQTMTPEQKRKVRQHFKRFKQLSPQQRHLLKHKYQRFQKMPVARRQALRERWKNLEPGERKQFREKRLQHTPGQYGQGLSGRSHLPADSGLNRPQLGDIPAPDRPQTVIRKP